MDKRLAAYLASLGAQADALDGWNISTAQQAGADVGFVITRGPEIHILPLVAGRALSRRNILCYVAPLLAEHGYVTTRVPLAETEHRLRTALGFQQTWSDDAFTYWALTELPYTRPKKGASLCQSSL